MIVLEDFLIEDLVVFFMFYCDGLVFSSVLLELTPLACCSLFAVSRMEREGVWRSFSVPDRCVDDPS